MKKLLAFTLLVALFTLSVYQSLRSQAEDPDVTLTKVEVNGASRTKETDEIKLVFDKDPGILRSGRVVVQRTEIESIKEVEGESNVRILKLRDQKFYDEETIFVIFLDHVGYKNINPKKVPVTVYQVDSHVVMQKAELRRDPDDETKGELRISFDPDPGLVDDHMYLFNMGSRFKQIRTLDKKIKVFFCYDLPKKEEAIHQMRVEIDRDPDRKRITTKQVDVVEVDQRPAKNLGAWTDDHDNVIIDIPQSESSTIGATIDEDKGQEDVEKGAGSEDTDSEGPSVKTAASSDEKEVEVATSDVGTPAIPEKEKVEDEEEKQKQKEPEKIPGIERRPQAETIENKDIDRRNFSDAPDPETRSVASSNDVERKTLGAMQVGKKVYTIISNGKNLKRQMDEAAVMVQGKPMLPIREIAGICEAKIRYDHRSRSVRLDLGGRAVELATSGRLKKADREQVLAEDGIIIKNGRMFVSVDDIRRVLQELQSKVSVRWDDKTRIVIIEEKTGRSGRSWKS